MDIRKKILHLDVLVTYTHTERDDRLSASSFEKMGETKHSLLFLVRGVLPPIKPFRRLRSSFFSATERALLRNHQILDSLSRSFFHFLKERSDHLGAKYWV